MSYAAIAAAIIGIIATAYTTYRQVEATEAQADYAKKEAEARQIESDAIRQSAAFEEAKARRKAAILISKQQAIGAAAGYDISTGTPLEMELDSTRQAEIEALNIRRTGSLAANQRRFQGDLLRWRARYLRYQKGGIIAGGVLSALSSGASVYAAGSSGSGNTGSTNLYISEA